MNHDNKVELINYRIKRAKETLTEVDTLIKNYHWNASVNRIYYACFYAVTAILLKNDLVPRSHKGVRQMFGLHFVQKGLISIELGKFYSDLFDKRISGDYDDFVEYTKDTIDYLLPLAIRLFNEIEKLIDYKDD